MTKILKLQRLNHHNPNFGSLVESAISTMCPLNGPGEMNQPFELE